jgi:hypothetical protein
MHKDLIVKNENYALLIQEFLKNFRFILRGMIKAAPCSLYLSKNPMKA